MKLEVRCCCHPETLIGWIDWPTSRGSFQASVTYPFYNGDQVTLEVDIYNDVETGRSYEAVKSRDVPLEKLRQIGAFEENTHG